MLAATLSSILYIIVSSAKRHHYRHPHELSDLQGRIVKGQDVLTPQQFPWFAAMGFIGYFSGQTTDPSTNATINKTWVTSGGCSATLIRSEYPAAILTAAHCVCQHVPGCIDYDGGYYYGYPEYPWINTTYSVLMNNTDITPDGWNKSWWPDPWAIDNPYAKQYTVAKIVTHPYYWHDEPFYYATINDTAILFLNDSVDGIGPVRLNDADNSADCCSVEDTLTAVGYGAVNRDNFRSQNPDVLQYNDNIMFVDTDSCNERISDFLIYIAMNYSDIWPYTGLNISEYLASIGIDYETNPNGPWQIIGSDGESEVGKYADSIICGGDIENGGVCFGDSGGPLIKGNDKDGVQVGITSFGWECDDEFDGRYNPPDSWITVSSQYEWIQQTLSENSDNAETDESNRNIINYIQFLCVFINVIVLR